VRRCEIPSWSVGTGRIPTIWRGTRDVIGADARRLDDRKDGSHCSRRDDSSRTPLGSRPPRNATRCAATRTSVVLPVPTLMMDLAILAPLAAVERADRVQPPAVARRRRARPEMVAGGFLASSSARRPRPGASSVSQVQVTTASDATSRARTGERDPKLRRVTRSGQRASEHDAKQHATGGRARSSREKERYGTRPQLRDPRPRYVSSLSVSR